MLSSVCIVNGHRCFVLQGEKDVWHAIQILQHTLASLVCSCGVCVCRNTIIIGGDMYTSFRVFFIACMPVSYECRRDLQAAIRLYLPDILPDGVLLMGNCFSKHRIERKRI